MTKEIVILTDKGILTSAVPLFARYHDTELDNLEGYSLSLSSESPIAYAVYTGDDNLSLVTAKLLLNHCEILGDL